MSHRPRLLLPLSLCFFSVACSSPSDDPKPSAPQAAQTPPPAAPPAVPADPTSPQLPPPSPSPSPSPSTQTSCDGSTSVGLLGTWTGTEQIAGESPTGSVPLHSTYRFCGSQTSGIFRLTAYAQDTPHTGCQQSADLQGAFTVTGTTLVLTTKSGTGEVAGCPVASDNVMHAVSSPSSRSYEMQLAGGMLTLRDTGLPADTAVTYRPL